jgi:hypothetical protein
MRSRNCSIASSAYPQLAEIGGEFVAAVECFGVVRAEDADLVCEQVLKQQGGLCRVAVVAGVAGELVTAVESVAMVGAEYPGSVDDDPR